MTSEIDIEVEKIISGAPGTSEFEDLKYFHDTIITLVEYNMDAPYRFSIYGALVEHRAVCEGYGESFKLLAHKVGIDVICIPSKEHLWNYARIDNHWYLVDITLMILVPLMMLVNWFMLLEMVVILFIPIS